ARRFGLVVGRVLDQGQHPAGHEAGGAHRGPGARHLADLDHPAPVGDLHPPPGPGRGHVVRPRHDPGVNDDLDPVSLHRNELLSNIYSRYTRSKPAQPLSRSFTMATRPTTTMTPRSTMGESLRPNEEPRRPPMVE